MHRRTLTTLAAAVLLSIAILLTGCSGTKQVEPTVPETNSKQGEQGEQGKQGDQGERGGQAPSSAQNGLPHMTGDLAALQAALGEPTVLTYRIVMADAPKGVDKTAYLDLMLGQDGSPGNNELLLVLFPAENHDIRFAMGPMFFEKKITVQAMLDLVRAHYLPKARAEDPATGLADLIRAVNQLVK